MDNNCCFFVCGRYLCSVNAAVGIGILKVKLVKEIMVIYINEDMDEDNMNEDKLVHKIMVLSMVPSELVCKLIGILVCCY